MGRCYNSTVVRAPVEQVWAVLRNFHDLSWASDVVSNVRPAGDRRADEVGARRILDEAFHETLRSLDDRERTLSYTIDDGPGPLARDAVKNYVGRIVVRPVTDEGSTFVEWESAFESRDEQAVGEFCDPIYRALLGALKQHFA